MNFKEQEGGVKVIDKRITYRWNTGGEGIQGNWSNISGLEGKREFGLGLHIINFSYSLGPPSFLFSLSSGFA